MTDACGAEVRTAHGAELTFGLVRSLVIFESLLRVEGEVELVLPTEIITSLGKSIVANRGTGMSLGDVSCVSGNLVANNSCTHIVLVGQCKMLLWSNIAKHGCSIPAYHGSAYGTRDMVVGRCDVGYERTESVERCTMTLLYLAVHVSTNLLHWHMSRTFDKRLHILCPCTLYELTHSVELRKLCRVVGIIG